MMFDLTGKSKMEMNAAQEMSAQLIRFSREVEAIPASLEK
jgi:hypothetical protein